MSIPAARPSVTSTQALPVQTRGYSIGDALCSSLNGSLIGALAGHIFSVISPLGGAIFGATSALASSVSGKLLEAALPKSDAVVVKIIKTVLPFIAGIAAAALVTSLCGFPITFVASLTLTGAIFLTQTIIFGVIACSGICCLGSIAVAGASGALPQRRL